MIKLNLSMKDNISFEDKDDSIEYRLNLSVALFPVESFFNVLPDSLFFRMLESFSEGVGMSYNVPSCDFIAASEEEKKHNDAQFSSVKFSALGEDVIISNEDFVSYLCQACDVYLEKNPQAKTHVDPYLDKIKEIFCPSTR